MYVHAIASFQQETVGDSPREMTIEGLKPGSSYNIRVHAMNEYGNSTSKALMVTTLGQYLLACLFVCLSV